MKIHIKLLIGIFVLWMGSDAYASQPQSKKSGAKTLVMKLGQKVGVVGRPIAEQEADLIKKKQNNLSALKRLENDYKITASLNPNHILWNNVVAAMTAARAACKEPGQVGDRDLTDYSARDSCTAEIAKAQSAYDKYRRESQK